jgi:hypothetical protein
MTRHVFVLEEGSHAPPMQWAGQDVVDPEALGRGDLEAWEKLREGMRSWILSGARPALEVFICLPEEEVVLPPDRRSLAQLLGQARDLTEGFKLFLVTRRGIQLERLIYDGSKSRELWMTTALEGRVQDILQPDDNSVGPREARLRGAADDAGHKYQTLAGNGFDGSWRCFVDPEAKPLRSFLSSWMQYSGAQKAPNLLIVVNDLVAKSQRSTVVKALRRHPEQRYLIATLEPASPELDSCCDGNGLMRPIRFGGPLELWYFLLRLNQSHRFGAASPSGNSGA